MGGNFFQFWRIPFLGNQFVFLVVFENRGCNPEGKQPTNAQFLAGHASLNFSLYLQDRKSVV